MITQTAGPAGPARFFPLSLLVSLVLHLCLLLLFFILARPPILLTLSRGEIDFVDLSELSSRAASSPASTRETGVSAPPKKKWFDFTASPTGDFTSTPERDKTGLGRTDSLKPMGESPGTESRETYRDTGTSQNPFAGGKDGSAENAKKDGGSGSTASKGQGSGSVEWDAGAARRELLFAPAFVLPEELRDRAIRAEAVVGLTVDPEGRVLNPVIQTSTGISELDRAVLETIRRYQFKALEESRSSHGTIRFTFLY